MLMVLASVLIATVALTGVYFLPTERMKNHVESSIDIFYIEETYPQQAAGYKLSQLDNETDAYMLLNAIYPRTDISALEAAMRVPRIGYKDDYSGRREIVNWLWLKAQPDNEKEYARYWHGYLLWLKPLLLLMDYADIRILNMIVQLFLFSFLIANMVEKGYKQYLVPLLVAEAVINPIAIAMSMQFSSIYYIVIISLLYLLKYNTDYLIERDYIVFTMIGIFTAFFDFLTYPLAAFGMAAIFILVKNKEADWKKNVGLVINWGIFWGIGYGGMWSCKWLTASIILRENVFASALRQAVQHTSDDYNALEVVWKNIKVFARWPYVLLGLGLIIIGISQHVRVDAQKWKKMIPFVIVALSPVLWMMVLKEHSGTCYWFTYRGLMVVVFALLCGLRIICTDKRNAIYGKKKSLIGKKNLLLEQFNTKAVALTMGFIFIISMMPVWYLAFYARPSGDDYGYSVKTHQAWLNTHSLIEVFKAGIETTKEMYTIWNGDWFTVFLFTWMPEVFVPYSFWIVPLISTLAVSASTIYFVHEITVNRLNFKWYESITIAVLILIASYQFIPSTAIGMYWYVGTVHYMLPHVFALLLLTYLSKFERTGRIRYILYSSFGLVMIGGSSYFSFFLVFFIYLPVIILCLKKSKKILLLGIPFTVGAAALFFQITAPGNAARAGESFGFSWAKIINTIIEALIQGAVSIGEYACNKSFVFILFIALAFCVWEYFLKTEISFQFRAPFLFLAYMYCIYAAMFTPVLYIKDEVSLGPSTMQYFTFILATTASIVYVEGWMINYLKNKSTGEFWLNEKSFHKCIMLPGICVLGIIVILFRGMLSDSVFIRSWKYVASGQADDFKMQIKSQMEILLDDSVKEAYLCPINQDQGPLMHMPVTIDPNAFTNQVVAGFYGKDMVIMQKLE